MSRGMNWTPEQYQAYLDNRAAGANPAPDRVSRVPSQETGPGRPGGENGQSTTSEMGKERTERHQDKRSGSNQGVDKGKAKIGQPAKPQKRGPNKTELRFYQEHIAWWTVPKIAVWEGIRLKLADGVIYVPDWVVYCSTPTGSENIYCYEVKGGFIKNPGRARTKFLVAREKWPCFTFEAWQWKNGAWKEIWK